MWIYFLSDKDSTSKVYLAKDDVSPENRKDLTWFQSNVLENSEFPWHKLLLSGEVAMKIHSISFANAHFHELGFSVSCGLIEKGQN